MHTRLNVRVIHPRSREYFVAKAEHHRSRAAAIRADIARAQQALRDLGRAGPGSFCAQAARKRIADLENALANAE